MPIAYWRKKVGHIDYFQIDEKFICILKVIVSLFKI